MALQSKHNKYRRIAIQGALATSGIAVSGNWLKPVVKSVVLPVHASSSFMRVSGFFSATIPNPDQLAE